MTSLFFPYDRWRLMQFCTFVHLSCFNLNYNTCSVNRISAVVKQKNILMYRCSMNIIKKMLPTNYLFFIIVHSFLVLKNFYYISLSVFIYFLINNLSSYKISSKSSYKIYQILFPPEATTTSFNVIFIEQKSNISDHRQCTSDISEVRPSSSFKWIPML